MWDTFSTVNKLISCFWLLIVIGTAECSYFINLSFLSKLYCSTFGTLIGTLKTANFKVFRWSGLKKENQLMLVKGSTNILTKIYAKDMAYFFALIALINPDLKVVEIDIGQLDIGQLASQKSVNSNVLTINMS
ncbi:hypothetical protein LK13_01290 [Paenibacillus polymyxa]|nr:hypothetical protein LK13_01290 [Paenibacillus polymyxa]KAF6581966.1 hypothetical protein G9G57_20135 [Paenibacillus sp. EKM211P]KAF6655375.1 hypothetical protein HFD99_16910 [Paenibacillus sp. EKM301P]RFT94597.1 hypothetical protein DX902_19370 [Paenibacillus jamilae]MBY7736191.1 hypothetical protein [Paenibacillus polymyxa]